jgi:type II secretory pathway component GspD/PulD (secretin)
MKVCPPGRERNEEGVMPHEYRYYGRRLKQTILPVLLVVLLCGCTSTPQRVDRQAGANEQKAFDLKEITPEQAAAFLSRLDLSTVSIPADRNAIAVTGSASDLHRTGVVLALVDTRTQYLIEALVPVSEARTVPANEQIAQALGGIAIGTFANPPDAGERRRAIIDIHGESVVAIIPAAMGRELLAFVQAGPEALRQVRGETTTAAGETTPAPGPTKAAQDPAKPCPPPVAPANPASGTLVPQDTPALSPTVAQVPPDSFTMPIPENPTVAECPVPTCEESPTLQQNSVQPETQSPKSISVQQPGRTARPAKTVLESPRLANGDDVLQLSLPERIEMVQLLDLAAEYLRLDYMCDLDKVKGQSVSLRLHGKLQGEIHVKDLYALLESVLKFKGYAMTCHKGGLVTIVPVTDALQVDPALVDPNNSAIEAGDMVVTRVFDLQYVNAASAMNLLDNMKLSVAVSPLEETQSLIVTCYAHRMTRIERLLDMIDKPGRPKEFRFRQLKYTMANTLTRKVQALVAELQTMPVTIAPIEQKPAAPVLTLSAPSTPASSQKARPASRSAEVTEGYTVYLDADERTNRILMIGHIEQLTIVEEVIEALDVVQHDPRILRVYDVVHLDAAKAKEKLEELEVIGKPRKAEATAAPAVFITKGAAPEKSAATESAEAATAVEEMQVTVLEATNSLLVNATEEQHARIATVLKHVDVVQQDLRTMKVYEIRHIDAEEVKKQLAAFGLIGETTKNPEKPAAATPAVAVAVAAARSPAPEEPATMQQAQVAVLQSTNSLLVNATDFQHARIASVIKHVDTAAREDAIPYEIYFLENQEPEHLAEVLQKILQEKVQDKDAKVEKTVRKTEEEIVIVPDKNTFSIIVYASMKNQEWISKLIKSLDKRRPQVLIDATLVEITKADAFTYDLNLLGSSPTIASTSSITGADPNLMEGRALQVDSGLFTAFYGDEHIRALLQTMQSKNYGRVLAKPKILVNDNEQGSIKTTDVTYVETSSSIPVTSGAAGPQTNVVQTAVKFESYEAGITLDITPHISEGDLRLDISLTRSDFLETADPKKPPNTRSNEITTKVTVPDGSTIILGGLLKLNQNKGGRKVPILGDIPLIGGLFRSINNKDTQNKLYVFVKAEIIRSGDHTGKGMDQLTAISERDRSAFERSEQQFQAYENWPGIKPKPVEPTKVLEAR